MKNTATCLEPGTADTASDIDAHGAPSAQQPAKGPQPIDPRLLMFVAGGSPKGGWLTVELQSTSSSPKGGWQ